ncbi:hypothetical protein LTR70_006611 [Exophiala xenobiotica]|uniref:PEST proteolytic signal-containing nuclear protein n=1 Tax=Lithohypha guttulata TaxID=1690604 RepID=A0ABR0K7Q9_9EURO|nr:hypothetical protein LTR24_005930 [Lithohypha guttulata]KAK5315869.1 hypothetical protein LTR70_006611 [Exophiala xenobiotica]
MVEYTLGYGGGEKFIATTTTTAAKKLPVKRPRKTGSAVDSKIMAAVYEHTRETESRKNMSSDQERDAEKSAQFLDPRTAMKPAEAQPQHVRAGPNIKLKADRMLRKLAVGTPAVVHGYSVDDQAHEAEASDAKNPFYRALHARFGSPMQAQKRDSNIANGWTNVPDDNEYDDIKRKKNEDNGELDDEIEVLDLS